MKRFLAGIAVLALWLAVSSLLTFGGEAPPAGVKVLKDLAYAKVGEKPINLDLYLPEKADGPTPVIVYVHGGAWQAGSKDFPLTLSLVAHGYAMASINYRLSQKAIFPAQIHDCKAAVRWLRAHAKEYNLDASRIGAWGDSAGGHLVALLGTTGGVKEFEGDEGNLDQSSRVQAVCDWFGPVDFVALADKAKATESDPVAPFSGTYQVISDLLGGRLVDNRDKAAKASPITYVTKDAPPFLIMHGDKDPHVPISQSETFAAALKKAGVDVTFKTMVGAGHDFSTPEAFKMVEEFFDKHLKGPAAAKPAAKASS
jgi:acetyl esterase/lipase